MTTTSWNNTTLDETYDVALLIPVSNLGARFDMEADILYSVLTAGETGE